MSNVTLIFAMD